MFKKFRTSFKFPKKQEIKNAIDSFSKKEYFFFLSLFAVLFITTIFIFFFLNNSLMIEVPRKGGSITEGIVGTPRFINPVLAISDADRDLTSLIYSGLMKKTPDGSLITDIAKNYTISEDGKKYTFTLKDHLSFHDGTPITTKDIVFTIEKARDPAIKSPKRLNWEGVGIEIIDDANIEFNLRQPYAPFLENATIGILPEHLWKNVLVDQFSFSELNINSVGSGPFEIKKLKKKSTGVPEYYQLRSFNDYALGKPHINKLTINIYQNEKEIINAYTNGSIDQLSAISGEKIKNLDSKNINIQKTVLPRIFGLFFNQSQAMIFTDKNIIEAMDLAIDKQRIIDEVLAGYGQEIDSPIPFNITRSLNLELINKNTKNTKTNNENDLTETEEKNRYDQAKEILMAGGWEMNEEGVMEKKSKNKKDKMVFEFSISTADNEDLKRSAEMIKEDLEKIGARVEIRTFEIGSLNQSVIRPRKYDALFFGQIITNESDLFAFWHSSQRNDPGLNIALYANSKADKLLEETISSLDQNERIKKYIQFEEEIKKDLPSIFIYSPEFIYITDKKIKGLNLSNVVVPSDRFINVQNWYLETDRIWKIFQ